MHSTAGRAPSRVRFTRTRSARSVRCREPMQSRSRSGRIGGGSLPQEDCMGIRRIIALDLGKFKTVACVMNAADRGHVFETIEMSPPAVHELLARHGATAAPHDTRGGECAIGGMIPRQTLCARDYPSGAPAEKPEIRKGRRAGRF